LHYKPKLLARSPSATTICVPVWFDLLLFSLHFCVFFGSIVLISSSSVSSLFSSFVPLCSCFHVLLSLLFGMYFFWLHSFLQSPSFWFRQSTVCLLGLICSFYCVFGLLNLIAYCIALIYKSALIAIMPFAIVCSMS
jgi:hypothetical protein